MTLTDVETLLSWIWVIGSGITFVNGVWRLNHRGDDALGTLLTFGFFWVVWPVYWPMRWTYLVFKRWGRV